MAFKERDHLHNLKRKVKHAAEAMVSYPEDLAKITGEDEYTKEQIFSLLLDEVI